MSQSKQKQVPHASGCFDLFEAYLLSVHSLCFRNKFELVRKYAAGLCVIANEKWANTIYGYIKMNKV